MDSETNKTRKEIENVIDKIKNYLSDNKIKTKFSGMTYEQGIFNALEWVIGENDDNPSDEYFKD
jgi:hypothetical protein